VRQKKYSTVLTLPYSRIGNKRFYGSRRNDSENFLVCDILGLLGLAVFTTAGGVGFRAEIIKSENVWAEIIQAFFNVTSGMQHLASLSAVVQENVLLPQATIRDSARESALAGAFERTGAC